MKRLLAFSFIATAFVGLISVASAQTQGIQQLNQWKTVAGTYLTTINSTYGFKVPGLATSTTGCLSVSSSGWITPNGSACASGGGASFSWPFPSNATSTLLTFNGGITVTGTSTLATTTVTALQIQSWIVGTSTTLCIAPEQCQFQVPLGSTATGTIVQKAITAAGAGGTINVKHGRYDISDFTPVLGNYQRLIGESASSTIFVHNLIRVYGDVQEIANLTLDVQGRKDGAFRFDGFQLEGPNKYIHDVTILNWTNYAIDVTGFDATYGSSTNIFIDRASMSNPGAYQTNGGSIIVLGGYKNIHVTSSYFGTCTNNCQFLEVFISPPNDVDGENSDFWFENNDVEGPFSKNAYFAGKNLHFFGNEFKSTWQIVSWLGTEGGTTNDQFATKGVEVSGNTFDSNLSNGAESDLQLVANPSYYIGASSTLQDVNIHHNTFNNGQIVTAQVGTTTIYNNIDIGNNTFRKVSSSAVYLGADFSPATSTVLTYNGLYIHDNTFTQWGSDAGLWGAIEMHQTGILVNYNNVNFYNNHFIPIPNASGNSLRSIFIENGSDFGSPAATVTGTINIHDNDFASTTQRDDFGITNYRNNYDLTSTSSNSGGINLLGGCFAIGGVCLPGPSRIFSYLFPNNATTTGLGIYASTTIGVGGQSTGLTVSGGATTTGALLVGNDGRSINSSVSNGILYLGDNAGYIRTVAGSGIRMGVFGNTDSLNLSEAGGFVGIKTTSPSYNLHVVGNERVTSYVDALNFVATSTTATSTFGAAITVGAGQGTSTFAAGLSATILNLTSTSASSTFANGINLLGGCFAIGGVCLSTGSLSFAYPFINSATSSLLIFSGGLLSTASTTIGNGNQNGGLTINGGATTTLDSLFLGNMTMSSAKLFSVKDTSQGITYSSLSDGVEIRGFTGTIFKFGNAGASEAARFQSDRFGVGTSSPSYARLSVKGVGNGLGYTFVATNSSDINTFNVQDNGNVGIGTTTPGSILSIQGVANFVASALSTFYNGLRVLTELIIPVATTPSLTNDGDIAINSTTATTSLVARVNGANFNLYNSGFGGLPYASSTLAYMGGYGAAGTTTILLANPPRKSTLYSWYCKTDVGTATVQFGDGSASTTQVCTTSGVHVAPSKTFGQYANVFIGIGDQTGSPNVITVTPQIGQNE